jgi:type IV pilus assembly protein PilQ
MLMRLKEFIRGSVPALFLLVVIAGCAQSKANIKGGISAEKSDQAVIQAINVAGDASQIEVVADRPLSYTYYKTSEPPKVVIDIAQTAPGSVTKALDVNAGNVKRIEIAKHEFTGGFLSRIEVLLVREAEFSVTTDSVDKGKLLITFARPAVEEKRVSEPKEEAKPASADLEAKPEAKQIQAEIKEETQGAPAAGNAGSAAENGEKRPTIETPKVEKPATGLPLKVLTAITANKDGVEMEVGGEVDTFSAFKLTNPGRLVIDMTGIRNGIAAKTVAINKFGIGQARLGNYPDKVRVVFDASKVSLPAHQVIKSAHGLKIVFVKAAIATDGKGARKPAAESAKSPVEAKIAIKPEASAIQAIDFKMVDGYSQISLIVGGDCSVGKPANVAEGLSLTIKNCKVPSKFQRMIDTSAFTGVVQRITPYQVRVKQGTDARILVKLRQSVPYTLQREGNTVYWNIENPEAGKAPAMSSEPARTKPEVVRAPPVPAIAQREKAAQAGEAETGQDKLLTAAPKPGEKKIYTGRRVSLEFSDADIRKILQLIAEVSNLNFLIGDDVSGTISIKLVNVPWDQALDVILETKGLEKRHDGNIMYVKPKGKFKTQEQEEAELKRDRERRMELRSKIFEISFATIGDVAAQFDKLKSDRGSISQDSRTNRVIVTDLEDRLEKMRNLLKDLDIPEKQVMIEARIVEATSSFTRDLGVQWGVHYQDGSASFMGINKVDTGFGGIVTPPPSSGTSGPGAAVGMSFGKLTSNVQLDLRLSAAATLGQIKIISTPKVVTLNNKAAKISQGQSIPYQTTSAEGTKTEFVEAALTLEVTPHIAADGSISMKIKASNNSPGTGSPPPINKKEATTELTVMNGETTVIGGIYVDSDTESNTGVPFLQDIPLMGWLFKSNAKQKTKSELLIFITPKVVS